MKHAAAIAALLTLMATGVAVAQEGGSREFKAQFADRLRPRLESMFKDIKVSDAILDKTVDIFIKASEEGNKVDRKAKDADAQMAAIVKKRNESIKALLVSPADKAKFDSNNEAYLKSRK